MKNPAKTSGEMATGFTGDAGSQHLGSLFARSAPLRCLITGWKTETAIRVRLEIVPQERSSDGRDTSLIIQLPYLWHSKEEAFALLQ